MANITVDLTRMDIPSKEYGKISKLVFPNKSRIYITKKGWNISVQMKGKTKKEMIRRINENGYCELNINFAEINIAIDETIKQGYVSKKVMKVTKVK